MGQPSNGRLSISKEKLLTSLMAIDGAKKETVRTLKDPGRSSGLGIFKLDIG